MTSAVKWERFRLSLAKHFITKLQSGYVVGASSEGVQLSKGFQCGGDNIPVYVILKRSLASAKFVASSNYEFVVHVATYTCARVHALWKHIARLSRLIGFWASGSFCLTSVAGTRICVVVSSLAKKAQALETNDNNGDHHTPTDTSYVLWYKSKTCIWQSDSKHNLAWALLS